MDERYVMTYTAEQWRLTRLIRSHARAGCRMGCIGLCISAVLGLLRFAGVLEWGWGWIAAPLWTMYFLWVVSILWTSIQNRQPITFVWFPLGMILFGLWLFTGYPVSPPGWLTEGPVYDPGIALPYAARGLYLSLLILVSSGPFVWIDTQRLRGRFVVLDIPAIARMILTSRRGAKTFLVLVLYTCFTVWQVLLRGVPVGSYFVRISLLTVSGVLMIILLPPTVIFLGSSDKSGRLLETVAGNLFPYRVVSLLDASRLGPTIWANKQDNLRTIRGDSWRSTVHRLVGITPLTIVDARPVTPAVCEEIEYMLHSDRVDRALFVINDDGSAPGLTSVRADWQQLRIVTSSRGDLPDLIAAFQRGIGSVAP